MNGDMLTDKKYLPIIAIWLRNIVLSVKQFLILFQNRIMGILIYAGRVMPKKPENIGLQLLAKELHLKLLNELILITNIKRMLGIWLDATSIHQIGVHRAIVRWRLRRIILIIQSHLMLYGCVDHAILPFTGKTR